MYSVRKNMPYLPIGILLIALVYSIYVASTTSIILNGKHYAGVFAVTLCIILLIKNILIGKILTFCTLILGALNCIAFTPVIYSYSIGFSINGTGIDLKIQEFSLLVLILFIIVNFNSIKSYFGKLLSDRSS